MSTPTLAQIKARKTTTYYELVAIETSTAYYLTNAPFDITHNSQTYTSAGALLSIGEIESNMSFEIPKLTLQINGIKEFNDGEFFAENVLASSFKYIDKPVTIYRVYFDQGVKIDNAFEIFKGFIDTGQVNYDPSGICAVALDVSSHWTTFDKTNGRRTNKNSQQFYYSADTGLNNCDEVQKEIKWSS